MQNHPFHVAGGCFSAAQPAASEAFFPLTKAKPPADLATAPTASSRRRKLWEIPHKFHCPVIGVCFGVDELRGLMAKAIEFPRETTDFVLHTTAVGACETRSRLADLLHKQLEKRFHLSIRAFSHAKDTSTLARLWRESAQTV